MLVMVIFVEIEIREWIALLYELIYIFKIKIPKHSASISRIHTNTHTHTDNRLLFFSLFMIFVINQARYKQGLCASQTFPDLKKKTMRFNHNQAFNYIQFNTSTHAHNLSNSLNFSFASLFIKIFLLLYISFLFFFLWQSYWFYLIYL